MLKSVKPPAELKRKVFSLKQRQLSNFSKGLRAEQLAADYLIRQGYLLLARNISNSRCEIDLVCLDKQFDELVFVEVKYRQNNNYGTAGLAVNQKKIRNMLSVAYDYLRKQQFKKNYRFDIIAVSGNLARARVEHFENITWL